MTLFYILNLNREFLDRLRDAGARLDDIDLFIEYNNMVSSGTFAANQHGIVMNKYHQIRSKVLDEGRHQSNRKDDNLLPNVSSTGLREHAR